MASPLYNPKVAQNIGNILPLYFGPGTELGGFTLSPLLSLGPPARSFGLKIAVQ
jgi:hypothetical protein